jgi:hypothetical protein
VPPGRCPLERLRYVEGDIGIGIFVDRNPGCGVRDKNHNHSAFQSETGDGGLNFAGDVQKLSVLLSADGKRTHRGFLKVFEPLSL